MTTETQQQNPGEELTPEQKHVEEMTRLAEENDALNNPAPQEDGEGRKEQEAPQRPEWCPEKYWNAETGEVNVEAMAKENAYLASKKGKEADEPSKEDTNPDDATNDKEGGEEDTEDTGADEQEAPKLDFAKYSTELAENGSLSEETYTEIEKATGIDRQMVEMYVEGMQARTRAIEDAVFSVAGDKESHRAMVSWAEQNLSKDELAVFDKAVTSLNPQEAKAETEKVYAKYTAANGAEPHTTIQGTAPETGEGAFKDVKEMMEAIKDPAYGKDRDYTRRVRDRIARSNLSM